MKYRIIAASAVLALVPVVGTVAPAQASNPPCMSRAEFKKIHKGMSLTKVAHIVGSRGKVTLSSPPLVVRAWKTCPNPFGNASVGFWSGHVQSKLFVA